MTRKNRLYDRMLLGIRRDYGSNSDILKEFAKGYFALSNNIIQTLVRGFVFIPIGLVCLGIFNEGIEVTLKKFVNVFIAIQAGGLFMLGAFAVFIIIPTIAAIYFQFRANVFYDLIARQGHKPFSKKRRLR